MGDMLARNWGWIALRGVVALIFGLLTLFNPAITLAALVLFFGAYALVDGIFGAVSAVANRHEEPHWVALLVGGIAGIIIGVLTFFMPGVTATVLLLFIAAWALVNGIAQIAAAIRLRKMIHGEWLLALAGVLSIAFGVILVMRPAAGALAMVLWIGAYAVVMGIVLILLAFRLRSWGREHGAGAMAM
ncbi:MAG TPA: HdeD family acid-resistance protein [Gemmatimonadaceae bacterium]|nr:HdeD family acid-resistance protein [Gemmatimonadaceae bacterium]